MKQRSTNILLTLNYLEVKVNKSLLGSVLYPVKYAHIVLF